MTTAQQVAAEFAWMQHHGATRADAMRELNMSEWGLDKALERAGHVDVEPVVTAARDALWRDRAACIGADPERFAPVDVTTPTTLPDAHTTARQHCTGCPVLHRCGVEADQRRHTGLWAGTWRARVRGVYERTVLIDGVVLAPLVDRRRTT